MLRNLPFPTVLLATALCLSGPAHSQDKAAMTKECLLAHSEGNSSRAREIVEEIKTWEKLYKIKVRTEARECLDAVTGEDWLYNVQMEKFISRQVIAEQAEEQRLEAEAAKLEAEAARLAEERALAKEAAKAAEEAAKYAELVRARVRELRGLVRQYDKTISEAEAARRDRRIETLSATVRECSLWFDDAPREALTNDTCNSIFTAGGLPNSPITGPSQLEEILAESAGLSAKRELEAVVSSGMLIEDYMAKYGSEEEADSYNCSE